MRKEAAYEHPPSPPDYSRLFADLRQGHQLSPLVNEIQRHASLLHQRTTSRDRAPHTVLNEFSRIDTDLLTKMSQHPLRYNNTDISVVTLLNGGYMLNGRPVPSMFSIYEGKQYRPTQVTVQQNRVGQPDVVMHDGNSEYTIPIAYRSAYGTQQPDKVLSVIAPAWEAAANGFALLYDKQKKDQRNTEQVKQYMQTTERGVDAEAAHAVLLGRLLSQVDQVARYSQGLILLRRIYYDPLVPQSFCNISISTPSEEVTQLFDPILKPLPWVSDKSSHMRRYPNVRISTPLNTRAITHHMSELAKKYFPHSEERGRAIQALQAHENNPLEYALLREDNELIINFRLNAQ